MEESESRVEESESRVEESESRVEESESRVEESESRVEESESRVEELGVAEWRNEAAEQFVLLDHRNLQTSSQLSPATCLAGGGGGEISPSGLFRVSGG